MFVSSRGNKHGFLLHNTDNRYMYTVQSAGEESVFVLPRGNKHGFLLHNTHNKYMHSPLERNPCLFRQEEINTDSYYITHITGTCTVHWRGIRVCFVKRKYTRIPVT